MSHAQAPDPQHQGLLGRGSALAPLHLQPALWPHLPPPQLRHHSPLSLCSHHCPGASPFFKAGLKSYLFQGFSHPRLWNSSLQALGPTVQWALDKGGGCLCVRQSPQATLQSSRLGQEGASLTGWERGWWLAPQALLPAAPSSPGKASPVGRGTPCSGDTAPAARHTPARRLHADKLQAKNCTEGGGGRKHN